MIRMRKGGLPRYEITVSNLHTAEMTVWRRLTEKKQASRSPDSPALIRTSQRVDRQLFCMAVTERTFSPSVLSQICRRLLRRGVHARIYVRNSTRSKYITICFL